jgi:hypothetical protein
MTLSPLLVLAKSASPQGPSLGDQRSIEILPEAKCRSPQDGVELAPGLKRRRLIAYFRICIQTVMRIVVGSGVILGEPLQHFTIVSGRSAKHLRALRWGGSTGSGLASV